MERSDIIHFLKKCLAYEGNGTFGRKIDLPVPLCPVGARQKKHTHTTQNTHKSKQTHNNNKKIKQTHKQKTKNKTTTTKKKKRGSKELACLARQPPS